MTGLPLDLDPRQFAEAMQSLENAILLDVRTPAEFDQGHLQGAMNFDIQKSDFVSRIESLDPDKPYLLYCKAGGRSANALRLMQTLGFDRVHHLAGGYIAWTVHEAQSMGEAE